MPFGFACEEGRLTDGDLDPFGRVIVGIIDLAVKGIGTEMTIPAEGRLNIGEIE